MGTRLDQPGGPSRFLDQLLSESDYLWTTFSVADVAVAAYLCYAPIFRR